MVIEVDVFAPLPNMNTWTFLWRRLVPAQLVFPAAALRNLRPFVVMSPGRWRHVIVVTTHRRFCGDKLFCDFLDLIIILKILTKLSMSMKRPN